MQWLNKKQIARAIYEENLVVAGRQVPKYRRKRIVPRRHHQPSLIILSLVIGVALAYSAVSISWDKPGKQLVAEAGVTTVASPMAVAMLDPEPLAGQAQQSASAPVSNGDSSSIAATLATAATVAQATGAVATSPETSIAQDSVEDGVAQEAVAIDNSLDHFFHDNTIPQPQNQLVSADLDAVKTLTHTKMPLARLFGLGVRTIVIDPGHGGKDPGAIGQNGTQEKDVALAIALRLRDRLKRWQNFNVYMTRDDDERVPLRKRVDFANEKQADLFVSIHINSYPSENMNFIETYYFGPNNDSKVSHLAEAENTDSDFVYAEFKDMLQKIGDTMKYQESKKLAAAVQRTLYTNMHKMNAKAHDHGIKPGPFVVLLGLDAPSILTEVTNLSDKHEEQRLNTSEYRDKIAKFLEKGIVTYLNKGTSDRDPITVTKPGGRGNAAEKEKLAQKETP